MHNGTKKARQNGGKPPVSGNAFPRVPKPPDPSEDLTGLDKMTCAQLVEAAIYNPHPEVRKKALGKLASDRAALQSIAFQTCYTDTGQDAENMLKALATAPPSDVKTE